jgi:hypothetical protein
MDSARRQSGAVYLKAIAGPVAQQSFSHQAARGIAGTQEKHLLTHAYIRFYRKNSRWRRSTASRLKEQVPGDKKSSVQVIVQTID